MSLSRSAEAALRQAEAERLTLLRSESSSTGFRCVSFNSSTKSKPYQATVWRGGKTVSLGRFTTPEEAALCYARSPEAQAAAAAPPEPPSMTAEAALRQAEAEELTLLRSESGSTGYKGVGFSSSTKSKPYQAKVKRGGKTVSLGYFTTPEEAALSYARTPEAQAAAAVPPAPPPMTAEEAVRQAQAEGLALLQSDSSSTGYKGVAFSSSSKSRPYKAEARRGGKTVFLGYYQTPEEAALSYARTPEAQTVATQSPVAPFLRWRQAQVAKQQLPAASSRKRKVESEEQPPDEPADVVVILEGHFVESTTLE